ncbi:MAG: peptide chain release factor N(5)-glutamine methyltransferase [Lentisphaeraceae bacterium]|nr:peptide chain release factor N(5)-glutamine methyltransferase [Lentisphaeraceae bacterium]
MKTIREIITLSTDYLVKAGIESARVEAEWLISHALDMPRMQLYINFDKPLTEDELGTIRPLLSRRGNGAPVQYITGSTEFYGLEIEVGPGVLIPRPETELLVDEALKRVSAGDKVLDLCTGSGIIAIAVQHEKKGELAMTASDICSDAMKFARKNIASHDLTIQLLEGDLFEAVQDLTFDLICSNPPYVGTEEQVDMGDEVLKFEPYKALFAGVGGMQILERIARDAQTFLNTGGSIICEMGMAQGPGAIALFESHGWKDVTVIQDYSSRDRFVSAYKS